MKTLNLGVLLNQGNDFSVVIRISGNVGPIDLTGYSFAGDIKASTDPDEEALASFSFDIKDQTTNKGEVQWMLSSAENTDIAASISDGEQKQRLTTPLVFDVKMRDNAAKVSRIIQGIVYLSPQVTQEVP